MKRTVQIALLCALTAALCGCWPRMISWSPDGKQALVIGADGLYLCDPIGNLSPRLAEGQFSLATWFSDSRRVALVRHSQGKKWQDVAPYMTAQFRQHIETMAQQLSRQIKSGQDWGGPLEQPTKPGAISREELLLVYACLRDATDAAAAAKLAARWPVLATQDQNLWSIHVATLGPQSLSMGPPVLDWLTPDVRELRINSTGTVIAFTAGADSKQFRPVNLWVVPANTAAEAVIVDVNVAIFPDWSADGSSLLYIKAGGRGPEDVTGLGALVRRKIAAPDGRIAVAKDGAELAGLIFNQLSQIRCLNDGRVLFSTPEVNLPATRADLPQRCGIFALDPEHTPTVVRMIPRLANESVPADWCDFEVSPDEHAIAITGLKGKCVVLSLQTGQAAVIEPDTGKDLVTVPLWRSPDQLCLVRHDAKGRAEMVLWSYDGTIRTLSEHWPKAVAHALDR